MVWVTNVISNMNLLLTIHDAVPPKYLSTQWAIFSEKGRDDYEGGSAY